MSSPLSMYGCCGSVRWLLSSMYDVQCNIKLYISSFSSLSHIIQLISLFVCLFLSFSCSVFVLALFSMFDDGLLS